jgi:hypothetical protein
LFQFFLQQTNDVRQSPVRHFVIFRRVFNPHDFCFLVFRLADHEIVVDDSEVELAQSVLTELEHDNFLESQLVPNPQESGNK